MNFPERITIPVDEEMREALLTLAANDINQEGNPMRLGAFCRKKLRESMGVGSIEALNILNREQQGIIMKLQDDNKKLVTELLKMKNL